MNEILTTVLISAVAMGVIFALIAIRLIVLKNGEFRGTCSTNNPLLRAKGVDCEVCHGDPNKCSSNPETAK